MAKVLKMDCAELFAKADAAGAVAAAKVVPLAMVVTSVDINDEPIPGARSYHVPEGVCGFAWVTVKPGNCQMAKWLKKFKGARAGYYGGIEFSVRGYGQSMQRKEAYAEAFAQVLREAPGEIRAYAGSRMD